MAFSDYIIFADESGSPVLDGVDPDFPVFVLAFVLVRKDVYANALVPALQRLKFDAVGHDQLVLHERDIRRGDKAFTFLRTSQAARLSFINAINSLVAAAEIEIVCSVIHKDRLKARYTNPWSPYELALQFCLEKALDRLIEQGQTERHIHTIFESRGRTEDQKLELIFRQITADQGALRRRSEGAQGRPDFRQLTWEPVFADKRSNSSGLQFADLFARPLGLSVLTPGQPNRAVDIIRPKIPERCLKIFP
ncbi:DUF3800 domain-containing protein [Glycocaulis sp.]|uniref:DUF3800 domain-containing protein n=1 Tax=Glycocaulis sp. TaxID=1969725 RepID=UPI003F6ED1D9